MGDIVGNCPRICYYPGGSDFDLSGGVADPDTDDVRADAQQESLRKQNRFSVPRKNVRQDNRRLWSWTGESADHPWLTLSVALSTLLLSVLLWVFIPKGFFPVQDNGIIQGTLQAPQSSSFANMAQRQRQVADVIFQDPAVQSLTSFVGVDGTNPSLNSARLQINLKPLDERDNGCKKSSPVCKRR